MDEVEPDPYFADGLNVNFRGCSGPKLIAEAADAQWARHVASALNYWAQQ